MDYCTRVPRSIIPAVHRIVVVGDIHGDWLALVSALKTASVTNRHGHWSGGTTHLVQVGDFIDRANRGRARQDERSESKIIDYLITLKGQAQSAGGDVHILLGNHEINNVMGDFRYVSPMGLTDFGDDRRSAFRPGGPVAVQLACHANAVVLIGSWLFSHAGVTEQVSQSYTPDQVNTHVRKYLVGAVKRLDRHIFNMFSHRDYADSSTCTPMGRATGHWRVKRMAIGHTVQSQGITNICNGTLWNVDVAMSGAFGRCDVGQRCIAVLEIIDDGRSINVVRGTKHSDRGTY